MARMLQDRPVRRGRRRLPQLRQEGHGVLQAEPLGLVPVCNRQHGQRNPSQRTQLPPAGLLPSGAAKIEWDTRLLTFANFLLTRIRSRVMVSPLFCLHD